MSTQSKEKDQRSFKLEQQKINDRKAIEVHERERSRAKNEKRDAEYMAAMKAKREESKANAEKVAASVQDESSSNEGDGTT